MDVVFVTVVQLTVTLKVMAFNFDGFMKNLPIPADLKAEILNMNKKQQESVVPGTDDVTSMSLENWKDFKAIKGAPPNTARKSNVVIIPTSTVMAKVVTEMNKPVIKMHKLMNKMSKPVTKINNPVTKMNKPVMQMNRLLRSTVTFKPAPCILKTTEKSPEKSTLSQPPLLPIPMGMPIYARVPIMLPMRTYYEVVEHDHPPLYKIKQIIEEDNKKWKEENKESDSDISVVIDDSCISSDQSKDTDTDTDSDSSNSKNSYEAPEYYDDVIRINVGDRDR